MLPWWYLSVLLLIPALGFPLTPAPDALNGTREPDSISDPADLGNNTMPRSDCNNSTFCKPQICRNQTYCIAVLDSPPDSPPMGSSIWLPTMNIHRLDVGLRPGDQSAGDTKSPLSPGKK